MGYFGNYYGASYYGPNYWRGTIPVPPVPPSGGGSVPGAVIVHGRTRTRIATRPARDTSLSRFRTLFERLARLRNEQEVERRRRLLRDDDDLLAILSGDE